MMTSTSIPRMWRSTACATFTLAFLAACADARPERSAASTAAESTSASSSGSVASATTPAADSTPRAGDPARTDPSRLTPRQGVFDSTIMIARAENPDVPEGILRDLAEEWGDDLNGLHVTRVDLDGTGEPEYTLTSWCGSSGVCESYLFRREPSGRFVRLLSADTDESGLEVLARRTHGYHDVRSAYAPQGRAERDVPFTYRYDGRAYAPAGYPVERRYAVPSP